MAVVPLLAGVLAGSGARLIVDTGDHPSAFFKQVRAGRWKFLGARVMEEWVYRNADAIVTRGFHHAAYLRGQGVRRVELIPDGVDFSLSSRPVDIPLRRALGLGDVLTVGIAGHFTWYKEFGGGLGSELVHALALLADLPVHGILIGDGPGLENLRCLAERLGVASRLHFLGKVPYKDYFRYLKLIDVCLLTQTNDPSSWVRTTGKLPAYMAAGRFILASSVGTAENILPLSMLVPYDGRWDEQFPVRLAERIRGILADDTQLGGSSRLRSLASEFDYEGVSNAAGRLILNLLGER